MGNEIKGRDSENERKFLEINCGMIKKYLWERGIQLSDGGKRKIESERAINLSVGGCDLILIDTLFQVL